MKVSVVIPAFNEAPTLAEILRRVQAVALAPLEREIIVVDNNSTDATFAIASGTSGVHPFRGVGRPCGRAHLASYDRAAPGAARHEPRCPILPLS